MLTLHTKQHTNLCCKDADLRFCVGCIGCKDAEFNRLTSTCNYLNSQTYATTLGCRTPATEVSWRSCRRRLQAIALLISGTFVLHYLGGVETCEASSCTPSQRRPSRLAGAAPCRVCRVRVARTMANVRCCRACNDGCECGARLAWLAWLDAYCWRHDLGHDGARARRSL